MNGFVNDYFKKFLYGTGRFFREGQENRSADELKRLLNLLKTLNPEVMPALFVFLLKVKCSAYPILFGLFYSAKAAYVLYIEQDIPGYRDNFFVGISAHKP